MRMLWSTGSKVTSSKDIIYYVKIRIQEKYSFSANLPSLWSQLVSEATGRIPHSSPNQVRTISEWSC